MNPVFLLATTLVVGVGAGALFAPRLAQLVPTLASSSLANLDRLPADSNKGSADPGTGAHAREDLREGFVPLSAERVAAQEIRVVAVSGGALARHITVPGTIAPDVDRIARVPARVVGTVAEMRKRLGDTVASGEVIAVLDSREVADAKSDYLTASVNFDLQKTSFERAQTLWDKRISAEQQYLQVRATFSEAELRFDLARQKLSALGIDSAGVARAAKRDAGAVQSSLRHYEIRAPIAGKIVARKVDVGAAVGKEGDPSELFTIADLSVVWVELTVTRGDIDKLVEGATVSIVTSGEGEMRGEAKIVFVSPILNPETRAAAVVAALPNPQLKWRPGSFVTAEINIGREETRVLVPRAALQMIGGEKVVFVRTPEGFQRRDVKLGRSDDTSYEVVSGLSPGDEIAVANTFLLKAELGKSEAKHDD
jgi:cobalt-zinc-cadmium efflux system membrane fusion protein